MNQVVSKAPNFTGTYPGAGERAGPAWQLAWETLRQRPRLTASQLAEIMCASIDIQDHTAREILREARKAKILTVKRKKINGRRQAVYQLADLDRDDPA